jgi:hypothetical protein
LARKLTEPLLDLLGRSEAAKELRQLPKVELLRQVWARHFVREPAEPSGGGGAVRLRGKDDLPSSAPAIESPYDPQARYRTRSGAVWTGYIVHLSESCEDDAIHPSAHARDDDQRHRARGQVHGGDPPGLGRQGPAAGRAPRGRGLPRRRASGAQPRGAGHRPGRPTASELNQPGRARSRVATRSISSRLTGSGSRRAARRGRCPRPGASRPTMPACPTSR